jgi:hypothetical protein
MTGTALTLLYLAGPRRWRRHRRGDSGGDDGRLIMRGTTALALPRRYLWLYGSRGSHCPMEGKKDRQ